jgi:tetratricopeptide (TPR) repeat protein/class 3 adenylate cyclase
VVSDGVLMVCIRELRQAFGDDPRTPQFIATVHRRGYRFIGQVTREPASAEASCLWLTPQGGLPAPARLSALAGKAAHLQQTLRQNAREDEPGETASAELEEARPAQKRVGIPASVWEQKPVAVLIIALTFPTLGSLAAPSYAPQNVASQWQQHIAEQVQRFGGVLLPGMPLLHVVAFGLPLTLDQMPQRAVQAALAIRHQVAEAARTGGAEPCPEVRLAVHVGEVLADVREAAPARVDVVGAGHFDAVMCGEALQEGEGYGARVAGPVGQVLALGETLALAVQLLGAAAPGDILVSPQVGRAVEGQCALQARALPAGARLRNHSTAYAVVGLRPPGLPLAMPGGHLLSPFVGRERELAVLDEWLAQAMHGRGQVVGLVGEPGVGKSRLITELRRRHATRTLSTAQEVMVLEGRCMAYGSTISYMPVRDLLSACLHLTEHTDGETLCVRLTEALQALDAALVPSLPALLTLLDVPSDDPGWHALDPHQRRQRTLDAVKHLLLRVSQSQPLLVIIEDVHWLDSETQALLDRLVDSLPTARILLLVSYRPEYQHGWGSKTSYTQLRLDPLPLTSAEDFLQALLGDDASLGSVKRLLIARIGGNPFFLEESLQTLVETGVLVGAPGAYRLVQASPTIQVPATVQAVLAARIDRLPPEEKHLLQTAAVIGTEVPLPLLQAIAELPEAALHGGLAHLQAAEFLYETRLFPEREYTFKHALTHEVAYNGLLQERRRVLHARITEAVAGLHPDRLAEHVNRLAYHALRGEVWDKALVYCRQAGEKALAQSARREVVEYFESALSVLPHLPETRATQEQAIDLRLALRTALHLSGDLGRLLAVLREAEALAVALDDLRRLGQISVSLTVYFRHMGAYDQAIVAAQRALALATTSGDIGLHALANLYLGIAYQAQGNYRRAIDYIGQAVASLDGPQRHERFGQAVLPAVHARTHLAMCHAELGMFAEGTALGEEGLQIAKEVAHPGSLMWASYGHGLLSFRQGDLRRALPLLEQAMRICQDADFPAFFSSTAAALGAVYTLAGRITEAMPWLTRALEQATATERVEPQVFCRLFLGETQMVAGHLEEAHALVEHTLALARERQERGHQVYALRLLGEIAAHRAPPDCDQAAVHYRQALTLAEELGMRPLMAHCHLGLGTLYGRIRQSEQAHIALSTALTLLRSMGMTFWLPQVEAVLATVYEGNGPLPPWWR